MRSKLRGDRKQDALLDGGKFCQVGAAIFAGAVMSSVVANKSSKRAANMAAEASQNQIQASEAIQQRQLDLSEKEFNAAQQRNTRMDALTERVTNSQLQAQDKAMALADEYADYNRGTFRPLEQRIVSEANDYDSMANQQAAADKAATDVSIAGASQRGTNMRTMARMGVNPTDGRFISGMGDPANDALAQVTAANTARDKIRVLGGAKRMDAASLGRGLPSAQATSAGLGINAGSSAINGQVAANGSAISGAGPGITLLNGASNTGGVIGSNAAALYGTAMGAIGDTNKGIGQGAGVLLNYYKGT
jgi:hypothetical protein